MPHRLLRHRLLIFVATAAIGCGDSLIGPSGMPVTFAGRVLEFASGSPVSGVSVTVAPEVSPAAVVSSQAPTSADGRYAVTVPFTGVYTLNVDGVFAGVMRVNGRGYRGDVFVRGGTCISRYGVVVDSKSLRPIEGVTLTLTGATARTGADGWYRIDLGCPDPFLGVGTTLINATHPDYQPRGQVVGRGVFGVSRLDLDMDRK